MHGARFAFAVRGPGSSADFQSAVSQVSNLRSARLFDPNMAHFHALPTGSRRYSRLETCATVVEPGVSPGGTPVRLVIMLEGWTVDPGGKMPPSGVWTFWIVQPEGLPAGPWPKTLYLSAPRRGARLVSDPARARRGVARIGWIWHPFWVLDHSTLLSGGRLPCCSETTTLCQPFRLAFGGRTSTLPPRPARRGQCRDASAFVSVLVFACL